MRGSYVLSMVGRHAMRVLLLVLGCVLPAACLSTDEDFPPDTARVEVGDRRHELDVISCGRDEDLDVFVLGASSADSFLQLLLVIDGDQVDLDASAVTFESRDTGVLAAGDSTLLGSQTRGSDALDRATIRGDRIDVEAVTTPPEWSHGGLDRVEIDLVARCSAVEEVATGAKPVRIDTPFTPVRNR